MQIRTLTTVLLVSVLMLATASPANAFFDIGGAIQRAQMIVNQATQIANQIRQMRTMTRQLTELKATPPHRPPSGSPIASGSPKGWARVPLRIVGKRSAAWSHQRTASARSWATPSPLL